MCGKSEKSNPVMDAVADLRTVGRIGAAHLFEIQIGDGLGERFQGMAAVISRPEQAPLFAEKRDEQNAALGMRVERGQSAQRFRSPKRFRCRRHWRR